MKPLIKKYQRDKKEIPEEVRKNKLARVIKSHKLTSSRISEITGCSVQTVRCWRSEKNRRVITTENLIAIYNFLGLDAYDD